MRSLVRWSVVALVLVAMVWGRPSDALGASVTLDPISGPVGTAVTAIGTGWVPNEQIRVNWNSVIITEFYEILAETRADANGRFQVNFTIPQTAFHVKIGRAHV